MTQKQTQRRLLQLCIILASCVPITAGGYGMLMGQQVLGHSSIDIALDNHVRYLSGLLFGIGVAFWNMVPWIEKATKYVRLLTLIIMIGGLARLYGAIFVDGFSQATLFPLVMELVVTPLLCLWQRHIARHYES